MERSSVSLIICSMQRSKSGYQSLLTVLGIYFSCCTFWFLCPFVTHLIIFMPLIYVFQILTMKENNLLKIISNCLSRFPLLSVIFSSVKCWSWTGTLLHSANVQSGISLCSSKALCAGLFCLMPICHWSSPLLSSASWQLPLAYFTSTKESVFLHFSPPVPCAGHSDVLHLPSQSPVI